MAKPSLTATVQGVETAKQTLQKAGMTQKKLCDSVRCSRQPITNFFKGEAISQELFVKICDRLNLDWQIIAGLKTFDAEKEIELNSSNSLIASQLDLAADIDVLVSKLRSQVRSSIREQCGTMRILDMSHPVEINDIYTNVNILEKDYGTQT